MKSGRKQAQAQQSHAEERGSPTCKRIFIGGICIGGEVAHENQQNQRRFMDVSASKHFAEMMDHFAGVLQPPAEH